MKSCVWRGQKVIIDNIVALCLFSISVAVCVRHRNGAKSMPKSHENVLILLETELVSSLIEIFTMCGDFAEL